VKWVRFEQFDKCLGTNVTLRVTPPPGATYSTGVPLPVSEQRGTVSYGGSRSPAGYVPGGTYVVEVVGGVTGHLCGGVNKYDLQFKFGE
jgi:hypothetical protein